MPTPARAMTSIKRVTAVVAAVSCVLCWATASGAAEAAAPKKTCSNCVPVFYPGLGGSKCFRIPTIMRSHKGTLLAFAENRISDCGDNGKQHDLVLRRSTDGGKSWGEMITVVTGTVPCAGCPAATSNPNPVEVKLADGSRAILLHYDTMNNPSPTRHGLDMQIWSFDDGKSWGQMSILNYPPLPNKGSLIGPSVGIQAEESGRIFFSAFDDRGHFLYWSSDLGKSWNASNPPIQGLNECSIAFAAGETEIAMNCRTGQHRRAQVIWSLDGVPGKVTYPKGLIDPGCQGSIVAMGDALYLSNANSTVAREDLTLKSSTDSGRSWTSGCLVWGGPSGYSQQVILSEHKKRIGVLFESGHHKSHEQIAFVDVEVTEAC